MKKHEIIPIGLEKSVDLFDAMAAQPKAGKPIIPENLRALKLVFAYGCDVQLAHRAANDIHKRDQSATQQIKWKVAAQVAALVGIGQLSKFDVESRLTEKQFSEHQSAAQVVTGASLQEVCVAKLVMCFDADLIDISSFCDVNAQTVSDLCKSISAMHDKG